MKASKIKSDFEKKPDISEKNPERVENLGRKGNLKKLPWTKTAAVLVLLLAVGTGIYYYIQYQNTQKLLKDPSLATEQEVAGLIEKIGKLVELPTGETPAVATVSDVNQLEGQPFFQNAKEGDKVLIYSSAKKAVLYRPSTNKIIELGPINVPDSEVAGESVQATPSASVSRPARTVILNGTTVAGLASTTEEALDSELYDIVSTGNAAAQNYEGSIVVDLNGGFAEQASLLANDLGGKVGDLPDEETAPSNADLLVILGAK